MRALGDRGGHRAQPGSAGQRKSAAYAPEHGAAHDNEPLPAVPDALTFPFTRRTLSQARHVATAEGARLGPAGVRLEDLALVTAELTTNSVVHGGGPGELRLWERDGYVLCEVRDRGRLDDPLAGRRPAVRGRLLVNLVADLVRVHPGEDGTTVRCWFIP